MKKENNIIKWLIPVVAVVVLAESVMLISNLDNSKMATVVPTPTVALPVEKSEATQVAMYQVAVTTAAKEMKLNQAGTVEVTAVGNADKSLDAVNVYLKYDPNAFEITNLTFDKKLPVPTFSKISQTTGLIIVNFLISAPAGLKVSSSEVLSLMKFSAKPVKTGVFSFEVSTGSGMKESATMFVENATSKILPFLSSKLTVNVSR